MPEKIKTVLSRIVKVIRIIVKSSFVQSTISMIMIASCILLGGFLAVYENKTNASIIANEYFQCYLRNDFKAMYDYIDVDESEYVNYDSFKYKMKNEKTQITFENYTVSKPVKKNGVTTVKVSYINGLNDKEEELLINLVSRRKKKFQIFPTWKVMIDDQIIKNVEIKVPHGQSFLFDSKEMTGVKETTETDDEGNEGTFDVYKIDRLFMGNHDIHIESRFTEGSTMENILKSNAKVVIEDSLSTLKNDTKEKAIDLADEMVLTFFDKVQNKNKTYKSLRKYFHKDSYKALKESFAKVRKILYKEKLESDIDGSLYVITSLNVSDLQAEIKDFDSQGNINVYCTCLFDFKAESDISGDNTYYSSYVSEYEGSYKSRFRLTMKYDEESENFIITDIGLRDKKQ